MFSIKRAAVQSPLMMNTIPPTVSTCFSVTLPLIHYPNLTAAAVQIKWPSKAPNVTMYGLKEAAKAIVAICDRSPHSARKVIMNACDKIYEFGITGFFFFWVTVDGSTCTFLGTKGCVPLCLSTYFYYISSSSCSTYLSYSFYSYST